MILSLFIFIYSLSNSKKIYTNQYIGEINISGLTEDKVKELILQRSNDFLKEEVVLKHNDGEYRFLPSEIGLSYDIDKTSQKLWQVGRRDSFFVSIFEVLKSLLLKNHHSFIYVYDEDALNEKLAAIKGELEDPPKDYEITYIDSAFSLSEDRKDGKIVDQKVFFYELKAKFQMLSNKTITFKMLAVKPVIDKNKANKTLETANKIIGLGDIQLYYKNQSFNLDKDTIAGFVSFSPKDDGILTNILDDRINVYIDSVAKAIDLEPVNAILGYYGNKLNVIESSNNGQRLNKTQARLDVKSHLQARINDESPNNNINLQVEVIAPEITDAEIEKLGIKELVGSGMTIFAGSPSNRIHNIEVGAKKINNILLKPGEEFSTIKQLGEIDAESGYLPELVIKEDRTVPEFGGGLCQDSSTLFRSVLNSGLKIIERKSHKYRVSYYEPPIGMDASIYNPSPDLRFVNNFNTHILIQSKVEGTKLTYEIFGSKDGRTVTISEPVTYDFVDPGSAIYVETNTLPEGEKKRIEKKAFGLTAKFNYEVKRAEEVLQTKTFISKYVPWPEKWLVGTKPPEVAEEASQAETTEAPVQ